MSKPPALQHEYQPILVWGLASESVGSPGIWMVFEYFGTSGIRSYIQQAIDQAGHGDRSVL